MGEKIQCERLWERTQLMFLFLRNARLSIIDFSLLSKVTNLVFLLFDKRTNISIHTARDL